MRRPRRRSAASPSAIRRIGLDRVTYRVPGRLRQDVHIDGLPLGTRGGIVIRHTFPLDAEYDLEIGAGGGRALWAGPPGGGAPPVDDRYVTLDGERVTLQRARRHADPRGRRAAHHRGRDDGAHATSSAPTASSTRRRARPASRRSRSPGRSMPPDPATRRAGVSCCLLAGVRRRGDYAARGRSCTRSPARAYRRPVPATGPEMDTLLAFYPGRAASAARSRAASSARWRACSSIRSSCSGSSANRRASRRARRSDWATSSSASRLSFFLWSSIPDDGAADRGANAAR